MSARITSPDSVTGEASHIPRIARSCAFQSSVSYGEARDKVRHETIAALPISARVSLMCIDTHVYTVEC